MNTGSLRLRLLLAATCAVAVALAIAGIGLVVLFERHVERRLSAELDTYLNQMAARTVFGEDSTVALQGKLADPRFDKVFSGLYWQIENVGTKSFTRSRSLWDTKLDLPEDMPIVGTIHVHNIPGPENSQLLTHERRLVFEAPSGETILRLAVAIDRADVDALTAEYTWEVALSLLLIAAILILDGWVQVNVGLKPLDAIKEGLGCIRDGRSERLHVEVPTEIAPLVAEVNSLLDAQERTMQRARDRAADLAHGFKTPLTALMADAERLRRKGEHGIADEIEATAKVMRGHIDRELSRARVRNVGASVPIEAGPVIDALIGTLKRTPQGESITFETKIDSGVAVRVDRNDLNEIFGNLLENAMRHARKTVHIAAANEGALVSFQIDDDGPGIAVELLDSISQRGKRLDSAPLGAGLGLAIVTDILEHYGQHLKLSRSELGGLKASFALAV